MNMIKDITKQAMPANRDYVVLVNEKAEAIGVEEKLKAHQQGLLHKAFSLFIFNDADQMLVQQRGVEKYHFAGLWSNACCSHPMPEETTEAAAHRRLQEELGFDTRLKEAFTFIYKVQDDKSGLYEHELDVVFVGLYGGEIKADENEIDAHKWVNIPELLADLQTSPATYSPWFKIGIDLLAQKGLLSTAAIRRFLG
jgi:isopentenyl-diphosphate Delta-isomerase